MTQLFTVCAKLTVFLVIGTPPGNNTGVLMPVAFIWLN